MATRDLTDRFLRLRATNSDSRALGAPGSSREMRTKLFDEEEGATTLDTSLPPMFVELMEGAKEDIKHMKTKMEQLSVFHGRNLRVKFDEAEEDHSVEILTGEIKQLFKNCDAKIRSIGAPPVEGIVRTPEEQEMRKNMQRSLATGLAELSQEFRKEQRVYMQKKTSQRDRRRTFSPFDEEEPQVTERMRVLEQKLYDPGFTEEQIAQIVLQEEIVSERDREIRDIAESITELAEIFQDLSTLVVEQGTILDRIDYNLEQSERHTLKAHSELSKASEYQRKARMKMCILLLIIGCGIMGLMLYLQK